MPDGNVGQMLPPKVREDKHVQIDNAIVGLDTSIARLRGLLDRVQGSGVPTGKDGTDKVQPCLLQILDGAAGTIQERSEQIDNIREQLTECLF